MKNFLLYIWQLPQNLVGLIVLAYCKLFLKNVLKEKCEGITYYYCKKFNGGISLGNYIISYSRNALTIKHEHGHQIQSLYLGPLYLFVIGIPSISWACLYGTKLFPYKENGYYKFYTERWAEQLGKVNR
jgi:hypothetical protein